MKRQITTCIFTSISIVLLLTLHACGGKQIGNEPFNNKPIHFESQILQQNESKASGASWGEDQIGIYMVKGDNQATTPLILRANQQYGTVGTGRFTPVSSQDEMYFPISGESVNFIAYYPYKSEIDNFSLPIDVSQQESFEQIDLLYSNDGTQFNKSSNQVSLSFSHALTHIVANINNLANESLDQIVVKLEGMATKGSFSLLNGELSSDVDSKGAIEMKKSLVSGSKAVVEAIVMPTSNLIGAKITITIPALNRHFEWKIPHGQNYLAKNRYRYQINLKEESIEVIEADSSIEDWDETTPEKDIDLDPIKPPVDQGDGSKENPYNVSQLNDHQGESQKWVKGYVVGTSLTTRSEGSRFEPPFSVRTNVLIADVAGSKNIEKCVAIELKQGSAIENALNLVDNVRLLGGEIMVKGDIVKGAMGAPPSIVEVTNHNAGAAELSTRYFYEKFGEDGEKPITGSSIDDFKGWSMKTPITYSDPYNVALIKGTYNPNSYSHLLLSREESSSLLIQNIPAGYRGVKLLFEMALLYESAGSANKVQIKCNGVNNSEQPEFEFTTNDQYEKFSLSIPDNTTTIQFVNIVEGEVYQEGFRIDNIELIGVAE